MLLLGLIGDCFQSETIALQRCGHNGPNPLFTISGTEWDELVSLVEADRNWRAGERERNAMAQEKAAKRTQEAIDRMGQVTVTSAPSAEGY